MAKTIERLMVVEDNPAFSSAAVEYFRSVSVNPIIAKDYDDAKTFYEFGYSRNLPVFLDPRRPKGPFPAVPAVLLKREVPVYRLPAPGVRFLECSKLI